jgi:hypothetical protein
MGDATDPTFFLTHMVCGALILIFAAASFAVSQIFRPIETHPWLHG